MRIASYAALLAASVGTAAWGASTATYRLTFNAEWSSTTHPSAYPSGAHFSPLIGTVHNADARFWELGGIATPGIEAMAERGRTDTLSEEFTAEIVAGNAMSILVAIVGASPTTKSLEFEATTEMPLLTMVTMVAPSPDWFVGVDSLDLRDATGWADTIVIDLYALDSGTDSGVDFTSDNADITPHIPITDFTSTPPFAGTPRLGTFTIELLSVTADGCSVADVTTQGAGVGDPGYGVPDGAITSADIQYDVNLYTAGDPAADLTTTGAAIGEAGYGVPDGAVTAADLQFFVNAWVLGCP